MTEYSGFWTTDDATPEGDQVASYDQAYWTYAGVIFGACNAKEGVAPNYLGELEGTPTTNNVAIDSGGGLVDGKWFRSSASQNVTIPSSSSGKTRIDRIVLRANWAGFNVSVYRIEGTETDGTPTAPTKESTSGTLYDILLYQALVNSSGTVTLTDERTWATAHTDGTTLTTSAGELKIKDSGVDSAQIAAGAIDTAHIANSQITNALMADNAIDSAEIVVGAIDNNHIRDSAGLSILGRSANSTGDIADIVAAADGSVLRRSGTSIGFGTVGTAGIANDAVDSDQIAAGAIDNEHLAVDSVGTDNIKDDAVDSDQIAAGAIDLAHMSANSVDSDQYVDGSIDAIHLANDIVDETKIGNRVVGMERRQGGGGTNWHTAGTNDYTPGAVRVQCGVKLSSGSGDVTVTFPIAFSAVPLVFIQPINPTEPCYVTFVARSASVFEFSLYNSVDARIAFDCYWLAMGPE